MQTFTLFHFITRTLDADYQTDKNLLLLLITKTCALGSFISWLKWAVLIHQFYASTQVHCPTNCLTSLFQSERAYRTSFHWKSWSILTWITVLSSNICFSYQHNKLWAHRYTTNLPKTRYACSCTSNCNTTVIFTISELTTLLDNQIQKIVHAWQTLHEKKIETRNRKCHFQEIQFKCYKL